MRLSTHMGYAAGPRAPHAGIRGRRAAVHCAGTGGWAHTQVFTAMNISSSRSHPLTALRVDFYLLEHKREDEIQN